MSSTTGSATVLIIEDDEDVRNSLHDLLTVHGYHVTTAANGRKALEFLRNGGRPDVILLDLMMPVMDGWEFRDRQRQDEALVGIPVLILSAVSEQYRHENRMAAAGYFSKPIDIPRLLETLSELEKSEPGEKRTG